MTSHNLPYTIAEKLRLAEHDQVIAQKLDVYQEQMTQFQQRYSSGA